MKVAAKQHFDAYKIYIFESKEKAIDFFKNDDHYIELFTEEHEQFKELEKRDGMTFQEVLL